MPGPMFFLLKSEVKMDIGEKLHLNSREQWRAWLAEHHQDKQDIWLVIYKSTSGR